MKRLGNHYQIGLPMFERLEHADWSRSILWRGATRNIDWLGVHVSRLQPGAAPEPVVRHQDEELMILLQGKTVSGLCDEPDSKAITRKVAMVPQQMVYHPGNRYHYLENTSDQEAIYLAVKWRAPERLGAVAASEGTSKVLDCGPAWEKPPQVRQQVLFNQPTTWLKRLQVHASTLLPGDGYPAHRDDHDVCIVVLEGELTSNATRYPAGSCLFHAAGWKHSLCNESNSAARYIVIELHGHPTRKPAHHWPELARDNVMRVASNLFSK